MASNTAVNFNPLIPKPLDDRLVVSTLANRDAIPTKYPSLKVYVIAEDKSYTYLSNNTWRLEDETSPNFWKWYSHFFDALGFNFNVNTIQGPDSNTTAIAGNPTGVAWLRVETASSYSAIIRRATTNGDRYQMQSNSAKYTFSCFCNFEVLPTAAANYSAGWSFHNTTGFSSDSGFVVFISNIDGIPKWTVRVLQNSVLKSEVVIDATITANTWNKYTIEVDRATSTYKFLINNVIIHSFTSANNPHIIPDDYYGFAFYSQTTTTRPTATRILIDYYIEEITLNTPLLW